MSVKSHERSLYGLIGPRKEECASYRVYPVASMDGEALLPMADDQVGVK